MSAAVDLMPLPAIVIDSRLRVVHLNPPFVSTFEPEPGLIGQPLPALFPAETALRLVHACREHGGGEPVGLPASRIAVAGKGVCRVDIHLRAASGAFICLIRPDATPPAEALADGMDGVSESGATAGLVSASREYRLLLETIEQAPVPWTLQSTTDFRVRVVNDAFCRMTGYAREEVIGRDPIELHAPESQQEMRATRAGSVGRRITLGMGAASINRVLIHKSGRRLPYRLIVACTVDLDGAHQISCLLIDLSRQQRLRGRLKDQWDWFRGVFEEAPVGLVLSGPGGEVVANRMAHELIGEPDDRRISDTLGLTGNPATRTERADDTADESDEASLDAADAVDDALEPVSGSRERSGESNESAAARCTAAAGPGGSHAGPTSRSVVRVDGRSGPRWFDRRQVRMAEGTGTSSWTLAAFTDTTREVRLQGELQAALLRQSALLRCVSAGLAHLVEDRIVQVNREMLRLTGRAEAELLGRPAECLFEQGLDWAAIRQALDVREEGPVGYKGTVEVSGADGSRWNGVLTVQWVDPGRIDLGVLLTFTEVGDLIRHSAQLQASVDVMRRFIDAQPIGVVRLEDGQVRRANTAFAGLFGQTSEQVLGSRLASFFVEAGGVDEALAAGGDPGAGATETALHVQLRDPEGESRDALLMLTPSDEDGLRTAIVIDLRLHRELAVRAARDSARFDGFARLSDEAMLVLDGWVVRYANPRVEQLTGLPVHHWVGRTLSDARIGEIIRSEDRDNVREAYEALLADGGGTTTRVVGLKHPVLGMRSLRVRLYADPASSRECYLLAEDITEHLRLERERLEEAVAQRDLLVREVHHRIKNNLQGVAGLLQQVATQRPDVAQWLNDASQQIQAIARVHGLEVRTGEIVSLKRFIDAVAFAGHSNGGSSAVPVNYVDGETALNWGLPQSEAVPMALILNELMTNALRHGVEGSARMFVGADARGAWLRMDNEGELPPRFDLDSLTAGATGLGLVKSLLPRRGATLAYSTPAAGTVRVELRLAPPAIQRRPESTRWVKTVTVS